MAAYFHYFKNVLQHISNTKIYFEIYIFTNHAPEGHPETTQLTFIPQLLAWYIQYQHIFSTDIYSPNCWQHIFNTNIYFNKFIFPNTAPEGRRETPTIHPALKCWPNISNTHMCSTDIYSPNCWLHISNKIFIFLKMWKAY